MTFIGDLNLDRNRWNDEGWSLKKMSNRLQEELASLNMETPDYSFTRRREDLNGKIIQSALDIAATNKQHKMTGFSKSNWHSWTDHCTITISINIGMQKQKQQEFQYARQLANIRNNQGDFRKRLSMIDWGQLAHMEDVNDCVLFYSEKIAEVIDEMAPMKKKKVRKRPRVKLSPAILEMMKERDEIRKQKSINPTPQIARKLSKIRGLCKKLIYREQMKTVHNLIKEEGKSAVWKIISADTKGKQQKEKIPFSPEETNEFFIKKVAKLNEVGVDKTLAIKPTVKIKESQKEKETAKQEKKNLEGETEEENDNDKTLFLKTVQEGKVKKIIQQLKAKQSCGKDNISSELLKIGAEALSAPLTWIINKSIVDKRYPEYWKEAIVKPLHKKGPKNNLKNYRPVSLLCVSGMILEAVVKEQLQDYLEQTDKLGIFQFGYHRNKSTSTAVNTMICQAKNDMNKGSLIAALMFDMSAAFDTVEKETVIEKLRLLGVSKSAREWINSYLSGRKQRVKIEDEESSAEELSLGTPQGSRLSPLLFNILTCDLDLYMKNGMCCNFADDTSISVEAETKTELIQKLEMDAEGMTTFTSSNNLVLNPGKTALICKGNDASIKIGHGGTKEITNAQNLEEQGSGPISNSWSQTKAEGAKAENDSNNERGGTRIRKLRRSTSEGWTQVNTIESSRTTDLLGMTIQGDLKWDSHVTELKKTLKKRIGVLTRLKHLVPKESLKMAAEAIFTSKLRYGIATYLRPKLRQNEEGNKTLKELTVLQNDMLRVISGKNCQIK